MYRLALLLLVSVVYAADTGCRIRDNCDGPAMVCYENHGNCVCVNGDCQCDGQCGPVWWLILIIVLIFLLAVTGLIFLIRACCCGSCCRSSSYKSI